MKEKGRCDWHSEKIDAVESRTGRIEKTLYTTNGAPGLIETVRMMARIQRWHTIALAVLLLLQMEAPLREVAKMLLSRVVTP